MQIFCRLDTSDSPEAGVTLMCCLVCLLGTWVLCKRSHCGALARVLSVVQGCLKHRHLSASFSLDLGLKVCATTPPLLLCHLTSPDFILLRQGLMKPRLVMLNSWVHLPGVECTGVCHHSWQCALRRAPGVECIGMCHHTLWCVLRRR